MYASMIQTIFTSIFWVSLLLLVFAYVGYAFFLALLKALFVRVLHHNETNNDDQAPVPISIVIPVCDKFDKVAWKVLNIHKSEYPKDKIQIIISCDGECKKLYEKYRENNSNITVIQSKNRIGKSAAQNQAIKKHITGDIIIFTDLDTKFDKHFLREIVAPFSKPNVGGVTGNLLFVEEGDSSIGANQNRYWDMELKIRSRESSLGILAVASGACMAIRKELFLPIEPEYGEDCVVPIDVVFTGGQVYPCRQSYCL